MCAIEGFLLLVYIWRHPDLINERLDRLDGSIQSTKSTNEHSLGLDTPSRLRWGPPYLLHVYCLLTILKFGIALYYLQYERGYPEMTSYLSPNQRKATLAGWKYPGFVA